MERVEGLPFADRDKEGLYIAEPVRRTMIGRMSGLEAERHALWRKRAADWITERLHTAALRPTRSARSGWSTSRAPRSLLA